MRCPLLLSHWNFNEWQAWHHAIFQEGTWPAGEATHCKMPEPRAKKRPKVSPDPTPFLFTACWWPMHRHILTGKDSRLSMDKKSRKEPYPLWSSMRKPGVALTQKYAMDNDFSLLVSYTQGSADLLISLRDGWKRERLWQSSWFPCTEMNARETAKFKVVAFILEALSEHSLCVKHSLLQMPRKAPVNNRPKPCPRQVCNLAICRFYRARRQSAAGPSALHTSHSCSLGNLSCRNCFLV